MVVQCSGLIKKYVKTKKTRYYINDVWERGYICGGDGKAIIKTGFSNKYDTSDIRVNAYTQIGLQGA